MLPQSEVEKMRLCRGDAATHAGVPPLGGIGPAEAGTPADTRGVSESGAMYHGYVEGPSRNMSYHQGFRQGESAQVREKWIAKPVSEYPFSLPRDLGR